MDILEKTIRIYTSLQGLFYDARYEILSIKNDVKQMDYIRKTPMGNSFFSKLDELEADFHKLAKKVGWDEKDRIFADGVLASDIVLAKAPAIALTDKIESEMKEAMKDYSLPQIILQLTDIQRSVCERASGVFHFTAMDIIDETLNKEMSKLEEQIVKHMDSGTDTEAVKRMAEQLYATMIKRAVQEISDKIDDELFELSIKTNMESYRNEYFNYGDKAFALSDFQRPDCSGVIQWTTAEQNGGRTDFAYGFFNVIHDLYDTRKSVVDAFADALKLSEKEIDQQASAFDDDISYDIDSMRCLNNAYDDVIFAIKYIRKREEEPDDDILGTAEA